MCLMLSVCLYVSLFVCARLCLLLLAPLCVGVSVCVCVFVCPRVSVSVCIPVRVHVRLCFVYSARKTSKASQDAQIYRTRIVNFNVLIY